MVKAIGKKKWNNKKRRKSCIFADLVKPLDKSQNLFNDSFFSSSSCGKDVNKERDSALFLPSVCNLSDKENCAGPIKEPFFILVEELKKELKKKEKVITDLEQRISDEGTENLLVKIQHLELENLDLLRKNEDLATDNQQLKFSQAKDKSRFSSFEEGSLIEIDELENYIENVKNCFKEERKKNAILLEKNSQLLQSQTNNLEDNLKEKLKKTIESLTEENERLKKEFDLAGKSAVKFRQTIEEYKNKLKREKWKRKEDLENSERKRDRLLSYLESVESEKKELEQKIGEWKNLNKELLKEINSLYWNNTLLENENKDLQLQNGQHCVDFLKNTIDDLQKKLEDSGRRFNDVISVIKRQNEKRVEMIKYVTAKLTTLVTSAQNKTVSLFNLSCLNPISKPELSPLPSKINNFFSSLNSLAPRSSLEAGEKKEGGFFRRKKEKESEAKQTSFNEQLEKSSLEKDDDNNKEAKEQKKIIEKPEKEVCFSCFCSSCSAPINCFFFSIIWQLYFFCFCF